jgi:hypothetical protein
VTTAVHDSFEGISCARPPSSLCVFAERTTDRKQELFSAVESIKRRGSILIRWDIDPSADFFTFDVSPDGEHLAVSANRRGPIHILSLRGQPEQVIPAEFTNAGAFRWSADSKGLYVDDLKTKSLLWYLNLNGNKHQLWQNSGGGGVGQSPHPMAGVWQSPFRAPAATCG